MIGKSVDYHIIEKHELADAALDAFKVLQRDMASYGFGKCWQENGKICYDIYRRIVVFWPEAPFGNTDQLKLWCKANNVEL